MQERRSFGPEFQSVSAARAFVRDVLRRWHLDSLENEASLLVTELGSNSVLHAHDGYTVVVSREDDKLRIGVTDSSHYLPVAKSRTRQAMTGRGLMLIEAYAHEWGVDRHEDGKTVWVELVIRAESSQGSQSADPPLQRPTGSAVPRSTGTGRQISGPPDLALPHDVVAGRIAA